MKKPSNTIMQISAPTSPIFAVYNAAESGLPRRPEDLIYRSCPVLALVADSDGQRRVVGLTVEGDGLEEPKDENFLGYVESKESGEAEFLS